MTTVRTVLGDVEPADLGVTYMHEHLIIDHPLVADRFPHISLPSVEEATAEVSRCGQAGVGAMVDTMPCASGRNAEKLAEVSRRTGVAVVAVTGMHTAKYYAAAPWAMEASADALAELFAADVTEGIDRYDYTGPVVERTDHRAGLIKAATAGEAPDGRERRVLEAAAMAHLRTRCPILTHCEDGRGAPAHVEALTGFGVDRGRVVLSHTDKVRDPAYHRDLLASGVNLEYDQALRQDPSEDRWTLELLEQMAGEGFVSQLMVGTDGARRTLWETLGGYPGLADLVRRIQGALDDATARSVLVDNPARFLAF